MSTIASFPLIWRWTDANHALFSRTELAGLHPCSLSEAACFYDDSRTYEAPNGLNQQRFSSVRVQSADISDSDGCAWLRTQAPNLAAQVTVLWDRQTALRTSWEFFTSHWDDFCYPTSDDVLVLPNGMAWVLRFHHEETFYFGSCNVSVCNALDERA